MPAGTPLAPLAGGLHVSDRSSTSGIGPAELSNMSAPTAEAITPAAKAFYRHASGILEAAGVPFLLGGAYALAHYTGITRHTKDLDLFLRRADLDRARAALEEAG